MPLYKYNCEDCNKVSDFYFSINTFLNLKDSLKCLSCNSQNIYRALGPISASVEKNIFDIKEEIKEEVNLISEKIKLGDQRTIESIYGKK